MRYGKIICIGWNYRSHLSETNAELPKEPIVFLKPTSCLIGNNDNIVIIDGAGAVHHEGELALIFGRTGKNIPRKEALSYVSHIACFNDVTARDMQTKARAVGNPWCIAKGMDTFGPMSSPVPISSVKNVQDLDIELSVNGTIRQKGNTSMMIFPVDELIAYVSRFMTIEEGDIMATGTPEGIGPLVKGDTVVVKINGVGELTNSVI
ncbi:MAG: fumarylacetoacetate hydrolase family protein [Methanomassiliicoccaceae archaeon]|jgi:2-keto-4-pentenoate hydratase/2-oxohepta-3-ene-1,7-dioic acid hydratase in catechol pathway|nr:fumarylacetoacetate hydrolase family protein [Methanomassiliicoccaceae archaeon]